MSSYLAWLRDGRPPVLLRDGFAFWGLVFGPFWLLVHAAWIPAGLSFALLVLLALLPGPACTLLALAVLFLIGLHGQDLRGWSLRQRGWRLAYVVAGRNWDTAYARLLTGHPELQASAAE